MKITLSRYRQGLGLKSQAIPGIVGGVIYICLVNKYYKQDS